MALPASLPTPLPRPQPGLVLYVSLPPGSAHAPGDLAEVAEVLREFATEMLPGAETYTALSLAPAGSDDAGLPVDPEFRAALRSYMEWAVADVLVYSPVDAAVPAGVAMPHWSWDGLQRG